MIARVFFGVLACLILAVGGFAYWLQQQIRGSLPVLSGEIALPGLSSAVAVQRDGHGRPVIVAGTPEDMAFALGFVHAQERFFQMDLLRRVSAGELAALFGPGLVEHDRGKAPFRLREHSKAILTTLPDSQRIRLEAYTAGANAGLAHLRARPFPYLLLRQQPEPWRAEDSLLAGFAKYFTLQDAEGVGEYTRALLQQYLPVSFYDLLFHSDFRLESPLLGSDTEEKRPPRLPSAEAWGELQRTMADFPAVAGIFEPEPFAVGSNSWVVAGNLTVHGYPIVSNDMHLEQSLPNVWYRARLIFDRDGQSVDIVGVTLPGIPGVVVGATEHLAWGFTNSNISTTDLKVWDSSVPTMTSEVVIKVAGGDDVVVLVEHTEYGPITTFPGDERRFLLQWTALLPCGLNLDLVDMETATTVAEALAIAQRSGMPTQNVVVADRSGNIGWTLMGAIPHRGSDGLWLGRLSGVDYPQVVNPPSGLLWTANNRIAVGEWRDVLREAGPAEDGRAYAIATALQARDSFDERDLLAIQLLNRTPILDAWQELLLQELKQAEVPEWLALRERVAAWSGGAGPDDPAHEVIVRFRADMIHAFVVKVLAPIQGRYPAVRSWSANLETAAYTVMSQRSGTWAGDAFDEAVTVILHRLAAMPVRPWRDYNQLHLQHPLTFAVPQLGRWLNAHPVGMAGDSRAPNAQLRNHGASQRLNVAPGQWPSAILHMPGGQSEHPLSPFYLSEQRAFVLAQPTRLRPGDVQYELIIIPSAANP